MAVDVSQLSFAYLPGAPPVLQGVDFRLAPGSRCLVLGANGAGKSTLLQLLAGQKMAPPQTVAVANEDPFRGRCHSILVGQASWDERMLQMKAGGPWGVVYAAEVQCASMSPQTLGIRWVDDLYPIPYPTMK
eukprot:g18818.t1